MITTLFARLFLSDLFLHGIGGAKYDQVTDAIIERFFGLKPPEYMTITATLRLPIARRETVLDDSRQIERKLRELAFHPEHFLSLDGDETLAALVREKRHWIDAVPTPDSSRRRCHTIRGINERLQPYLTGQLRETLDRRAEIASALGGQAILASRDYAFCLYPEAPLRQLMSL